MTAQLRLVPRRTRPFHWLWGPALALACLAGCVGDQKSDTAKSTTPQVKDKPAAARPTAPAAAPNKPAPAPAPAPGKPAPGAAPAPAEKPKTEKPKDEPPPASKKPGAAGPSADQPPNWPVQEGKPMTEEDREALANMIRAAAEEGQKRQAAEHPPKAEPRAATTQPATTQPGAPPKKEGCGATGGPAIDLNPPPPDQPQPKFACQQKKVVTEGVWQGKTAEFSFTIGNEGEALLAVRIKPG